MGSGRAGHRHRQMGRHGVAYAEAGAAVPAVVYSIQNQYCKINIDRFLRVFIQGKLALS